MSDSRSEIERLGDGTPGQIGAPALELIGLRRRFTQVASTIDVLKGIDLRIVPGEMVALVGPSGSGKSTLLQIAGLLEPPSEGRVVIDGKDCGKLSERDQTRLRRDRIGFIYQFHHLLPEFSARENVMLPQLINGLSRSEARDRADQLLDMVGLSDRTEHRPAKLSGGEQQRVAIVRAIANVPKVLLADEPTGNLDPSTAENVFSQLRRIVQQTGIAALVATHNHDLARRMDRILELRDGRVVSVE
ncbi:MAG: ABC transporter ATP-binding protein [Rhodospirillaceae bacterium]|jgi:lipoprotein-releasing system ATP-binding protein|nr:ABC transporter ATP-binding protein [Rhodospirillaceae bacterium]